MLSRNPLKAGVWSVATTMKSMEEDKEPSTESVYGHYVGGVKVE